MNPAKLKIPIGLMLAALFAFATLQSFTAGNTQLSYDEAFNTDAFRYFKDEIVPIITRSCNAKDADGLYVCHGQPKSLCEMMYKSVMNPDDAIDCLFVVDEDSGTIETEEQIILAYQRWTETRKFMMGRESRRVDYRYPARFSPILRKPLIDTAGGMMHLGGDVFESTKDPGYVKMRTWVEMELARKQEPPEPLEGGKAGEFFKAEVLPVLMNNSCMVPSCHEFNHSNLIFDMGVPSEDGSEELSARFTNSSANANRQTTIGKITNMVALSGPVSESRIITKCIPIQKGGVMHKGGNDQFLTGPEDPHFQTLVKWLELEREELAQNVKIQGEPVDINEIGKLQGIVFVRTRTENYRQFLDIGKFLPGSDLFMLKLKPGETLETASSEPVNLTAQFHPDGPADIREPDVRYDGRAIVFAMRKSEEDNLNIYEIELDENYDFIEGSLRRLTYGPKEVNGNLVHYTDPTYVPDADDENAKFSGYNLDKVDLVLASNIAGEVVQSVENGILGEADGGDRSTVVDYQRPEPDGSFIGRRIFIVDGTNKGEYRDIIDFQNRMFTSERQSYILVDRPFPEPIDASSVYFIEKDPRRQPGFLPSYSCYGLKYSPKGQEEYYFDKTLARFTFSPGQEFDLSVRSTGEIYYGSLRYQGYSLHRPIFNFSSNRRHLDKAFSFPTHHGNRSQVPIYTDNREFPDGTDIHVVMNPQNLWEAGNLIISDHQLGCDVEPGNPIDDVADFYQDHGRVPVDRSKSLAHPRTVAKTTFMFPTRGKDAVSLSGISPQGGYRDTFPLLDGTVLCSHTPESVNFNNTDANPDFDLYWLIPQKSFHVVGGIGYPKIKKVKVNAASEAGYSEIQAAPIYIRLKERMRGARRDESERYIQRPEADRKDDRPAIYCEQNYLIMDAMIDHQIPTGKHVAYAKDPVTGRPVDKMNEVKYVRVVEGLPMTNELVGPVDPRKIANGDPESTLVSNGLHGPKRIIAEMPVNPDGSVCGEIPGNTPFVYQSLNEDMMALRSLNRWFFIAPNEYFFVSAPKDQTFQQCAACHGSMTGRPEDTYGPIDMPSSGNCWGKCHKMMEVSVDELKDLVEDLGNEDEQAGYAGKVTFIEMDPKKRITIDFERDIQPIFDRHCLPCHSGTEPAEGLDLSGDKTAYYNVAYESLMQLEDPDSRWYDNKKYVSEREALAIESYVIEKLYGKEFKAPRQLSGDYPHPSAKLLKAHNLPVMKLSEEEKLMLVRWIDLGATYRGAGR